MLRTICVDGLRACVCVCLLYVCASVFNLCKCAQCGAGHTVGRKKTVKCDLERFNAHLELTLPAKARKPSRT
jgi:hypothetical protein